MPIVNRNQEITQQRNKTEIAVSDPVKEAKARLKLVNRAKRSLLRKDDHTIMINNNEYVKRQGWRVLAMVGDLNLAVVDVRMNDNEVTVIVRASDKKGRFVESVGGASKNEDFYRRGSIIQWGGHEEKPSGYDEVYFMPVYKGWGKNRKKVGAAWYAPKGYGALVALAHTRALNRAISDYFGGPPSAEEVEAEQMSEKDVFESRVKAVRNLMLSKWPLEEAKEKLKEITGVNSTSDLDEEGLEKLEQFLGIRVDL